MVFFHHILLGRFDAGLRSFWCHVMLLLAHSSYFNQLVIQTIGYLYFHFEFFFRVVIFGLVNWRNQNFLEFYFESRWLSQRCVHWEIDGTYQMIIWNRDLDLTYRKLDTSHRLLFSSKISLIMNPRYDFSLRNINHFTSHWKAFLLWCAILW